LLEGGLRPLAAAREHVHLLEMSLPNAKQDGTYHCLKVKVDEDGLKSFGKRRGQRGFLTREEGT
jgi:hypothetical protein